MKKYRLSFCDVAHVEYDEKSYKKLENVLIELKGGERVQGKIIYVKSDNLKHEIIIYTPVDNFEVIEE